MLIATIAILVIGLTEGTLQSIRTATRARISDSDRIETLAQRARAAATDRALVLRDWAAHQDPVRWARYDSLGVRLNIALDSLTPLVEKYGDRRVELAEARAALARWDSVIAMPTIRTKALADIDVASELLTTIRQRFTALIESEEEASRIRLIRQARLELLPYFLVLIPLIVLATVLVILGRRMTAEQDLNGRQLTELRELAVARARSDSMLAAALEGPSFIFAFLDTDLRFVQVSEGYARLNGVPRVDHLGSRYDTIATEQSATVMPHLIGVLSSRRPTYNVEVTRHLPNGDVRRLIENFIPVISASNELIGVGITLLDITDRLDLESRFLQAQKMEAVGRVAGGVAHDFKNLLTVIRSYSELLLMEPTVAEKHSRELHAISGAAERATTLARQLLSFSRKSGGKPEEHEINAAVAEAEPMIRRLGDDKVKFTFDYSPSAGRIFIDQTELEQILLNLAVNAVDAMPDGGTLTIATDSVVLDELAVRSRPALRPGRYARVRVTDTGQGMPQQVLDRLFEPFFTTKPMGQGTGLGLSTAWGIVSAAKGSIEVSSHVGRGTTFTVHFPIAADPAAVAVPESAPALEPDQPRYTILVVDDETLVRDTLSKILTRKGYRVLGASSGAEAVQIAAAHTGTIDLLVSDVMMPGMGGLETAERIGDVHPGLHVLFMSGYTEDQGLRDVIDAKTHSFIAKPFSAADIVKKIEDIMTPRGTE